MFGPWIFNRERGGEKDWGIRFVSGLREVSVSVIKVGSFNVN